MKTIGIIGSGAVAQSLGTGLINLGYQVKLGSRDPKKEKLVAWRDKNGANASLGTFAEAAAFGELLIIATLFRGTESAVNLAGKENFTGKVVIDTTNPIADVPPVNGVLTYTTGNTDSAMEQIQRWLPEARLVKAFSIIGNRDMVNPSFAEGDADMYICGNDDAAKKTVTDLLRELGWKSIIDFGGMEAARPIEQVCVLWCLYGFRTGTWHHAIKIIK